MRRVNYDEIAATYNQRYEGHRYQGVRDTLRRFIGNARDVDVVEIGCGTGHWLAELADARSVTGIDPSWEMLRLAAVDAGGSMLVRARAEAIPLADASADRIVCINALHHFADPSAFAREARRILRAGGAVMTVGLDPHTALDEWWVYDYFPTVLTWDRIRYSSTDAIRAVLTDAGFSEVETIVAQHTKAERPFATAVERGHVDRTTTSQLMVISDAEYEAGVQRITADQPMLRSDLRLYATIGRVPAIA